MELPIGTIIMWGNDAIPSGWTICDGNDNTPDLRSRFVRGANQDNMLSTTGGVSAHIHSNNNTSTRPNHNHGGSIATSVSGSSSVGGTSGSGRTSGVPSHSHDVTVQISSAGSHSHTVPNTTSTSILPKHIKRVFIMKVA